MRIILQVIKIVVTRVLAYFARQINIIEPKTNLNLLNSWKRLTVE